MQMSEWEQAMTQLSQRLLTACLGVFVYMCYESAFLPRIEHFSLAGRVTDDSQS